MYQAVIFSFKVSQFFIVHESVTDIGIFGCFLKPSKKCIILQNFYQIVL